MQNRLEKPEHSEGRGRSGPGEASGTSLTTDFADNYLKACSRSYYGTSGGTLVLLAVAWLTSWPSYSLAGICDEVKVVYRSPRTSVQSCGVDSLYACLLATGNKDIDLKTLENELPYGPRGSSLEAIARACKKASVSSMAVRVDHVKLRDFGQPMILHVNKRHYIALLGSNGPNFLVFDNQAGLLECTDNWFHTFYDWDGIALAIGPPSPSLLFAVYGKWVMILAGAAGCLLFFIRCVMFRAGGSQRQ